MPSVLYMVGSPIGNLSDITLRAVETLKSVDAVACEDTRHSQKLLHHLGLQKRMIRYDENVHERGSREIIDALTSGKSVAVLTDAGTPGVSDPGARLVKAVVSAGFPVIPIPGPSSVMTAISASGLGTHGFTFLGFLPRKSGPARRELQEALGLGRTVVLFESPFRVSDTLQLVAETAPESHVVVGRELTKIHEEFIRGTAEQVRTSLQGRAERGEFVILIDPQGL